MAKVNIYLLASHRPQVIEIQAHFLRRVRNKEMLKLCILATTHIGTHAPDGHAKVLPIYYEYADKLRQEGIDTDVVAFESCRMNYMNKIEYAQQQPSEFSVKLDEDLWFNENVWDFMIEQGPELLADRANLVVSPILSNGIPTCDMFLDDFFPPEGRKEIHQLILGTNLGQWWGVDYRPLNEATLGAQGHWDPDRYYSLAARLPSVLKGMHPVRVNYQLNRRINDYIVGDWNKFSYVPYAALRAESSTRPYLCNSVFMIRSETWRQIVANKGLFRDDYDEIPLNLYREQNGLRWVFIRNGYGMHMIYNTVQQYQYEQEFTSYCLNLTRGLPEYLQ